MKSIDQLMNQRTVQFKKAGAMLESGFVQVPRTITRAGSRISHPAKIVFATLLDYAWQDGFCYPAQQRLARDISMNEKSVRKYLAELEGLELIEIRKQGRGFPNKYLINDDAPVLKEVKREIEREQDERRKQKIRLS